NRLLVRDAGPLEGLCPLTEGEIFNNLAITKHEPVGKSSAGPFCRVFQANPGVEIYDNLISIHQVSLRLASPFRPSPASFLDVLLHFPNAAIGAGCWKAFGLNAHDSRIKIGSDGRHVIAIDCSEELPERFSCGFHVSIIATLNIGPDSICGASSAASQSLRQLSAEICICRIPVLRFVVVPTGAQTK